MTQTPTSRDLEELALKVERLSGPDRITDAESHRLVAGLTIYDVLTPQGDIRDDVPRYTASLDAAMSLVPEGLPWEVTTTGFKPGASVCTHGGRRLEDAGSYAATPALALVAASLRARARSLSQVQP